MALFFNPYKNYFLLSRQPWKWLYLKYVWATLFFVRLPIWFIFSLIPWMRPRASWTIKRTLLVKSLQELVPMTFNTGQFKETVRVNPQKYANNEEEVGLVWIDAVPQMIQGEIKQYAKTNRVSVVHVPAYWFGRRDPVTGLAGQPASLNEKVILNLHSGGWVMGDASPVGTSAVVCKDMLSHYPQFSRVLNVEYRLSQGPPWPMENPFPAAVIDAIVAYNYLVNDIRVRPQNILISGDSAGGTLAYQLVRYIVNEKIDQLPPPGGLLLLSPSMDWGDSHKGPGMSFWTASNTDWVHAYMAGYCTKALLGRLPSEDAETNPWFSPASHNLPKNEGIFTGFPPTLFVAGDAEMTIDAMKTSYDRMVKDVGMENVDFVTLPDATHVVLSLPWHEEEKEAAYQSIKPFIDRYFRS